MPLSKKMRARTDATGLETLSDLVQQDNYEAICAIFQQQKTLFSDKSFWSHHGQRRYFENALRDAVVLGQTKTVQLFLDAGFSINTLVSNTDRGHNDFPLIYFAAKSGDQAMVQFLIDHGARITDSLELIHEKMCVARDGGYAVYDSDLWYNYSEKNRVSLLYQAFHALILENNPGFYSNYQFKPQSQDFFIELNEFLLDIEKIQGSDEDKTKITDHIVQELRKLGIQQVNKSQVAKELNNVLGSLRDFDLQKSELQHKRDELKKSYGSIVKVVLDHAIGVDFKAETKHSSIFRSHGGLIFLHDLDVSDFNFLGVSVAGQPITREMLIERRVIGAENALISIPDVMALSDEHRRSALLKRITIAYHQSGPLISSTGTINLVPLHQAAEVGDVAAVKSRLAAGIDPNEADASLPALVLAATNGHAEVVKVICEKQHKPHQSAQAIKFSVEAIQAARKNEHFAIAEYLESMQDINERNSQGETLLHLAVQEFDIPRIIELIAKGADVNSLNNKGQSALDIAASTSGSPQSSVETEASIKIIQLLLKHHARVEVSSLAAAIDVNSERALSLLLPHVNKQDVIYTRGREGQNTFETLSKPWYISLLFKAANSHRSIELLESLKEHGADFNQTDVYGNTILSHAIDILPSFQSISKKMEEYHRFKYDLEINHTPPRLEIAEQELKARFEIELELIHYLLESGAEPHHGHKHETRSSYELLKEKELNYLANKGYKELLTKLKEKGGHAVHTVCENHPRLLHVAVDIGDTWAVDFLLKHGADIHIQDDSSNHHLHKAVRSFFPTITLLLIKAGADPLKLAHDGTSILELLESSYTDMKRYLAEQYKEAMTKIERSSSPSASLFGGTAIQQERESRAEVAKFFHEEHAHVDRKYHEIKFILAPQLENAESPTTMY